MKYQPPYGAAGDDDPYVNGNPATGTEGSIPPAEAIEYPQREITNFLLDAGMTPDNADLHQLARASRKQFGNFAIDTGAANALSVALSPSLNPEGYLQGLPLRVLVANNNTGATTINVNGLGTRAIKRPDGTDLQANDLVSGMIAVMFDTGTVFQLENPMRGTASTTNTYTVDIPYIADTGSVNAIQATYSPAITSIAEGKFIAVKMANTNTGAVTIKVNGLTTLPVKRNDGAALQKYDLRVDEIVVLAHHSTYYQVIKQVPSQYWQKLSADTTLYIRTDGNDSHDGSANDAAHAFLTIQAAIDFAANNYVLTGRTITYQLGNAGTYSGAVSFNAVAGSHILRGDPANQDNYIVAHNISSVIGVSSATLDITGIQVRSTGANCNGVSAYSTGVINVDSNVSFNNTTGVAGQAHIMSFTGGQVNIIGNIKILASAAYMVASLGGAIFASLTNIITVTAPSAVACTVFAVANAGGRILFEGSLITFIGSWTGQRYQSEQNALISTAGSGASYFPGSTAGTTDTGGVYV